MAIAHIPTAPPGTIEYPESDGKPMADNTKQFRWIVTIEGGLDTLFANNPDIFVAGDLLWYPVEGRPDIRGAPDVMVVFGRPKGDRGSYLQWQEQEIAPQVVFEILSPGNTFSEMQRKLHFYERFGVEEYYLYDPDENESFGWLRSGKTLNEISFQGSWTSARLGIRFESAQDDLHIYHPNGERFKTFIENSQAAEQEHERAERLAAQLRALGIEPEKE